MQVPEVTVLLPVYNGGEFLKEAIDSILRQTFPDFELLVIDDGSVDQSLNLIQSYPDKRIRIISHDVNQGLIATLNEGLQEAKGKYVVRMDADDISFPERIKKQVSFMNTNPAIGASGTQFKDVNGKRVVGKSPTSPSAIKANLFFSCVLAHPTMILRKEVFLKNNLFYNPDYPHAEDYELWVRASRLTDLENLPEVLLDYRFHTAQVSSKHNNVQRSSIHQCQQLQLNELAINPTKAELEIHYAVANLFFKPEQDFVDKAEHWLLKLVQGNANLHLFSTDSFNTMIGYYWYNLCSTLYNQGFDTVKHFFKSAITKQGFVSTKLQLKFKIKYRFGFAVFVKK